ncbi:unnamed protein product [Knipowitschia caucasica]
MLLLLLVFLNVTSGCGGGHGQGSGNNGGHGQGSGHGQVCGTTTAAPVSSQTPIHIVVTNSVTSGPSKTYSTFVSFRGILIGGMRRLQEADNTFTFTYTEDPNYGPFLQSVNGLHGNFSQETYWMLQVKLANGTTITPNVGIGCYIPNANDEIIFKYTSYASHP